MKYNHFELKLRALIAVCVMFVFGIANAQQISVSGIVKDAVTGDPVLGASVTVKGSNKGVITDTKGAFVLSVPSNATLTVKYIGYTTVEVPVAGKKNLVIQLKEDAVVLGEVVAIGYGTVKKNDATGSVTAIKPDAMNKGLTPNAQDMIVGKIAGVTVTTSGGAPGGGATVRIRGGSSIYASNDPLYIIDGLPMDNDGIKGVANLLSTINPNDIETFTVLKDASATAIYGSRASNGVIIITTKKGKEGSKPHISYNGSMSVSALLKKYDVMSGDEFRTYVRDLYGEGTEAYNKLGTANTDWQSQIYQTALSHDHSISVSGGLKKMPYRANIGYTNQDGIVKTSNFERYTASVNVSPSLFDDHLKMNLNVKGMLVNNRYADTGAVGAAISMDPTQSVTSSDATYANFGGYWQWTSTSSTLGTIPNSLATKNPVAMLMQKNDVAKSRDLIANADLDYKFHFLPELHAHLLLGIEDAYGKQTTTISTQSGTNYPFGNTGYDKINKTNKQLTYYMQYFKEIGSNKFNVMAGYEWQHFYNDEDKHYENLVTTFDYNGTITTNNSTSGVPTKTESYLASFFGRANYTLLDRYLLTATVRRDGSSRFSSDNRWGTFPSAAFAWKIKEESFLKDNNTINDLKLRVGYGVTGQQNVASAYAYLPVYVSNTSGAYYPFGSTYYTTWRPSAYNKNLKWEQTTTYNAGVDCGIINNRITSTVDVYYRPTKDLIFNNAPIAQGSNFSNVVIQNIGSLYNKGVEFTVTGKPIVTKDLTWDINFNATYNYNKVTKITSSSAVIQAGSISSGTGNYIQGLEKDFPAYSFYVYQQVYGQNGKPIEGLYVDRNADGKINDDDRYMYHNAAPDYTMGLSSKLIYKNIDLGISFHSSIGNYVYNDMAASRANIGLSGVYSTSGFLSNIAKSALETNFTGKTNWYFSDYYVQNASFVKLDNITLGYSFKHLFKVIESGRISATVQNVATFTKYKGLDPEVSGGIDKNLYPRPFMTVLGLSLNF